jgi:hypothetical protein
MGGDANQKIEELETDVNAIAAAAARLIDCLKTARESLS